MNDAERQDLLDNEHLRLLRIGYLIAGGMNAFFAVFPLMYVVMGLVIATTESSAPQNSDAPSPQFIGYLIAGVGIVISLVASVFCALKFMTARAIRERRSLTLCRVTAGLTCLGIPYGTALGVLTFVVLGRSSVQALFTNGPKAPVA